MKSCAQKREKIWPYPWSSDLAPLWRAQRVWPDFFCPPAQAIERRQTSRLVSESLERYGRKGEPAQMQNSIIAESNFSAFFLIKAVNPFASARLECGPEKVSLISRPLAQAGIHTGAAHPRPPEGGT